MKTVTFIYPPSPKYRESFHYKLRDVLAEHGVRYKVAYCAPQAENRRKADTVDIPFGRKVPLWTVPGIGLQLQGAFREVVESDLIIIQQENKLLLNYLCNLLSLAGIKQVAYFGHGRNFQAQNPNSIAEKWKRVMATKVNWWFAYTEETKRHLASIGFPETKITVFNNAVDVRALVAEAESLEQNDVTAIMEHYQLSSSKLCIYVGGIYPEKRPDFLIKSADLVKQNVPDFQLVVAGGGSSLHVFQAAEKSRPWLTLVGPQFGKTKAALMREAKLFLMPGLVGLAVLDAAAMGLPVVTTAYPFHSPEICYLDNGVSGAIVQQWESPEHYAEKVVELLRNDALRKEMGARAKEVVEHINVEKMVERFSKGVLQALGMAVEKD